MNKTKLGLAVLLATLFGFNAQAGVLVEPYLGLGLAGSGNGKVTGSSERTELSYIIAPTAGLKLGYSLWGVELGLDASYQRLSVEKTYLPGTGSISLGESDLDKMQAGIFLSYNLPIPVKFWVTYYVLGNAKFEDDSKYTASSGYAFGGSYTGFSLFSINLEYRNMKYDEFESVTGVTSAENAQLGEMLLSVSMPFDFELF